MKAFLQFFLSVAIPVCVGGLSGYLSSGSISGWFRTIKKPSFNPPDWVFAPVWTALYIIMGIAFFLVWKKESEPRLQKQAMVFYFVQLAANFFWSLIFFNAQQPGWALVEIIFLWIMIICSLVSFKKISSVAAWLMVPYLCWVSFAMILNYFIWRLNS